MSQVSNIPSVGGSTQGSNPCLSSSPKSLANEGLRVRIPSDPPPATTVLPTEPAPTPGCAGFGGTGVGGIRARGLPLSCPVPPREIQAATGGCGFGKSCPDHPDGGPCEPMQGEPWRCVYGEHLLGLAELAPQRRAIDRCACGHAVGQHRDGAVRGVTCCELASCDCPRFVPHPQPVSGEGEHAFAGSGGVGAAAAVHEGCASRVADVLLTDGKLPVFAVDLGAVEDGAQHGDAIGLREAVEAGDQLAAGDRQVGFAVGTGLRGGDAVVAATTEQEQGKGESAHGETSGAPAYRPNDHSVSPRVLEMLDRYQDSAWRRLQADVDAATPHPEPAHSAPPAQGYPGASNVWHITITDSDPGLRPGFHRVEVKQGNTVVYVWAGAPSHREALAAAEEFIRQRCAAPAVVSCTTLSAPAPEPEPNWEGDPLEAAFALDVPEDTRDRVLHELKRREELYDAAQISDGCIENVKGVEDDFICRLLSLFDGFRPALLLLALLAAVAIGCSERPDSPDSPDAADAGTDAEPPSCLMPPTDARITVVFVPCDDPATAQCEIRWGDHNTVPSCVVGGRTCVASCGVPTRGEVHQ